MAVSRKNKVRQIPVNSITVLNPRDRNANKFQEIVDSISNVGLKRPITVSQAVPKEGGKRFNLVCGQGRLEAFIVLKQSKIPAMVINASKEDCYLMSLVENLARRHHTSLELMRDIETLADRGYTPTKIAAKTGLSREYVTSILHLLRNGEERLVTAVERNQIPLTVAIEISNTVDADVQQALTKAYERNELRGNRLKIALRIVQQRQRRGKGLNGSGSRGSSKRKVTANAMIRAYKQETKRQRIMVMKSDLTERRLMFFVSALKELFNEENFVTLLRAENLHTVPRQIIDLIHHKDQIG